ncbi:arylacetamide deacetylase-like [Diadema setosum]|uniref:arylacetamide deacetylase-like n=1 Tax=Diadema setosum TaxID=31175 RepID=UPI003B3B3D20
MTDMGIFLVMASIVAFLCWYVGRIPVPRGLTQPVKYRLLMVSLIVPRLCVKVYMLLHPGDEFANLKGRRLFKEAFEPTPREYVRGSNIRSRVAYFDGVRVRVYEPIKRNSGGLQPAFVFIHGGGMVMGSPESYDGLTRRLAERLDMVVVSFDYRLAPEYPFPIGYNDNLRALTWFLQHAEEFGVDSRRVAVGGDSAGGSYAAALSQDIYDNHSLPNIKLQILIYPGTQQLDFQTHSHQKLDADFGDYGVLSRKSCTEFVVMYARGTVDAQAIRRSCLENMHYHSKHARPFRKFVDRNWIPPELRLAGIHTKERREMEESKPGPDSDAVWREVSKCYLDPRFAPIVREDLRGLPRAFVLTCGFDSMRDDGIYYALRLKQAGVNVLWKHYESAFHGIFWISKNVHFRMGLEMQDNVIDFIKDYI